VILLDTDHLTVLKSGAEMPYSYQPHWCSFRSCDARTFHARGGLTVAQYAGI
jgi:hypothetical protein